MGVQGVNVRFVGKAWRMGEDAFFCWGECGESWVCGVRGGSAVRGGKGARVRKLAECGTRGRHGEWEMDTSLFLLGEYGKSWRGVSGGSTVRGAGVLRVRKLVECGTRGRHGEWEMDTSLFLLGEYGKSWRGVRGGSAVWEDKGARVITWSVRCGEDCGEWERTPLFFG